MTSDGRTNPGRLNPQGEGQRGCQSKTIMLPSFPRARFFPPRINLFPYPLIHGRVPEAGPRLFDSLRSGACGPRNGLPPFGEIRDPASAADGSWMMTRTYTNPWSDRYRPTQAKWRACFFRISRKSRLSGSQATFRPATASRRPSNRRSKRDGAVL